MRHFAAAALLISLFPKVASGQPSTVGPQDDVQVSVNGLASASIHFIDDKYVGSPYLSEGLGGVAPNVVAGVNVTYRGMVASVELAAEKAVTVAQEGRLVGGRGVGKIDDTLFSVLAGATTKGATERIQVVGGITRVFGGTSLDGAPVKVGRWRLTAGFDVIRRVTPRLALLGSFRFLPQSRSNQAVELGVGSNVVRVAVGIRVELTKPRHAGPDLGIRPRGGAIPR